jgi:hypothetical protein
MAVSVFNIAKGRVNELVNRVATSDPAGSAIVVVAINRGTVTDAQLNDADTLADVLALGGGIAELANAGYSRGVVTNPTTTVDDTNDRRVADTPDVSLGSAVAAGTNPTDVIFCYRPAVGSTNAQITPLTHHPFAVTIGGGSVTVQVNDFYRAS